MDETWEYCQLMGDNMENSSDCFHTPTPLKEKFQKVFVKMRSKYP